MLLLGDSLNLMGMAAKAKLAKAMSMARLGRQFFIFFLLFAYVINNLSYGFLPIKAQAFAKAYDRGKLANAIYITRAGDSLNSIAKNYNISAEQLLALNSTNRILANNVAQNLKKNRKLAFAQILPKAIIITIPAKQRNFAAKDTRKISADLAKFPNPAAARALGAREFGQRAANFALARAARALQDWGRQYATISTGLALANGFNFSQANLDVLWPFYDGGNLLIFTQGSLAKEAKSGRFNLGFGQRYFRPNYMLGLNGFFDYDLSAKAARLALGGEFWLSSLRFALNSYFPVGDWRTSLFSQKNIAYKSRAAHGFDMRASAYLPFYPQIALMTSYEQYFGQAVDLLANKELRRNPFALTLGVNYKPVPLVNMDLAYKLGPKLGSLELSLKLAYQIGVSLQEQLNSRKIAALRRLSGARYSFVERNNNIVLAYKPDIVVSLRDVSGFAGEVKSLVARADFSADWKIKGWINEGALSLSKECFSEGAFAGCKVTLPAYKPQALAKNNVPDKAGQEYHLILLLMHRKQGREYSYHSKVTVNYKAPQEVPVVLRKVSGFEFEEKSLVAKANLGANWKIKQWLNKDGLSLSKECFSEAKLAACRVTLPSYKGQADNGRANEYHLTLSLTHLTDGGAYDYDTTIRVAKKSAEPVVLRKVSGFEFEEKSLVAKADLGANWKIKQWLNKDGLSLSKECFSEAKLAACRVTLPSYKAQADNGRANEYPLTLSLTHLTDGMAYNYHTIIRVAKRSSEPVVLRQVSGFEFEEKSLVERADLAANWKIKQWLNKDGLSLSKECFSEAKLAACRVTLPSYKEQADNGRANEYPLTLSLTHITDGMAYNYHTIIRVAKKSTEDEFVITFKPVEQLKGQGGEQLPLFKQIKLGGNWQVASWQIRRSGQKKWQEIDKAWLSASCWQKNELGHCSVILPANEDDIDLDYDLMLFVKNESLKKNQAVTTQFTVLAKQLLLELNDPIKEVEASSVKLFKAGTLPSSWQKFEWDLGPDFTKAGGKLSKECYEREDLLKCEAILPRYERAKARNNSSDYRIALSLSKANVRTRKAVWHIKVLAAHQDAQLSLQAFKNNLVMGEVLPISASLSDKKGNPIDLPGDDLARYFALDLAADPLSSSAGGEGLALDAPSDAQEQSPFLSDLKAKGRGLYEFKLHAGGQLGRIEVKLSYADICHSSMLFSVMKPEDAYVVNFEIDRQSAILQAANGKPLHASFDVRTYEGRLIDAKDLSLKLVKADNSLALDAARIALQASDPGDAKVRAVISAQQVGVYYLALYYRLAADKELELGVKKLHFISGRPSDKSKFYFNPPEVAPDASAGFPAKFTLFLEAYDEYGEKLNYRHLLQDEDSVFKNKFVFLKPDGKTERSQPLDFEQINDNVFSFGAKMADFLAHYAKGHLTGHYQAQALYDGVPLDLRAELKLTIEKSLPKETKPNPHYQRLNIIHDEYAVIDYSFTHDDVALLVPKLPIIFKVFKVDHDSGAEIPYPAAKLSVTPTPDGKGNRVTMALGNESGQYVVKAYYELFKDPSHLLEIINSKAIIDAVEDHPFDPKNPQKFIIEPDILRASGELNEDRSLKADIYLFLADAKGKRFAGLKDVKAKLVRQSLFGNTELGDIALTETKANSGIYHTTIGLYKDNQWLEAGDYRVRAVFNGKEHEEIQGYFTINLSNLKLQPSAKMSSDIIVVDSAGGAPQTLEFHLQTKGGYAIPYERTHLWVFAADGSPIKGSEYSYDYHYHDGRGLYTLFGHKVGEYYIQLKAQDYKGDWQLIFRQDLHFIDGMADRKYSTFYMSAEEFAPDSRGWRPDHIDVVFKARDKHNRALDYEKLLRPGKLRELLKLRIIRKSLPNDPYEREVKHPYQMSIDPVSGDCPDHNCYSWVLTGEIYDPKDNNYGRCAFITFGDKEVVPPSYGRYSFLYMLSPPTHLEVTPHKAEVYVKDKLTDGPKYRFYWKERLLNKGDRRTLEYHLMRYDKYGDTSTLRETRILKPEELERTDSYDELRPIFRSSGRYIFKAYYRPTAGPRDLIYVEGSEIEYNVNVSDFDKSVISYRNRFELPSWHKVGRSIRARFDVEYNRQSAYRFYLRAEVYRDGYKVPPTEAEVHINMLLPGVSDIQFTAHKRGRYQIMVFYRDYVDDHFRDDWRLLQIQETEAG